MKCPNVLKNKRPCNTDLQTKRTIDNGRTVTREKHCPKCKARYFTTELFNDDIKIKDNNHRQEVQKILNDKDETETKLHDTTVILTNLAATLRKISDWTENTKT